MISHYIQKQFFVITHMELSQSTAFSQNICETCFDLSRDLAAFREQLIQIQKSLEDAFSNESNVDCDVIEEDVFNGEVLIKVEPVDAYDNEDVDDSNDDRPEAIESLYEEQSEEPSMQESSNPQFPTSNDEQTSASKRKMCEICGVWYSSMNFKRHFDRVHLKRKNFCCDICNLWTFKKSDMVNHVRSHFKVSW